MDPSNVELLVSGLKLMFIGMGIVFFFLVLLVGVIQQAHVLLRRWESEPAGQRPGLPPAAHVHVGADQELVAVIAAAVHRYEQS